MKYEGALQITHNATSMILLGGENRTTADGDVQFVIHEGSGNWRELAYFPVAVNPAKAVSTDETQTLTNKTINLTSNTLVATSAQLATAVADETGSGALVFATSPTLVTPALGTPASGVLTNCTGLPQAGLANSAVGQAQLKTTTGEVTTASTGGTYAALTLPGGTYGFYPQVKTDSGYTAIANILNNDPGTSYVTNVSATVVTGGGGFVYIQHRYVQASPPYNLGNGDIPLFMFVLVDSLGKIHSTYVAPEPPWAYNGPTDIRADYYKDGKSFQKPRLTAQQRLALRDPAKRDGVLQALAGAADVEITHAIKNADMALVPHPFLANDLTGYTVVLLDVIGSFGDGVAALHQHGESIAGLLHGGALVIDNTPLQARVPRGVVACRARWK